MKVWDHCLSSGSQDRGSAPPLIAVVTDEQGGMMPLGVRGCHGSDGRSISGGGGSETFVVIDEEEEERNATKRLWKERRKRLMRWHDSGDHWRLLIKVPTNSRPGMVRS